MKHMKKKLTAILLAIAMVLSVVPLTTTVSANVRGASIAEGGYGIPEPMNANAAFGVGEALQILRYLVGLNSVIRHSTPGARGLHRANGFWEYELQAEGRDAASTGGELNVADALSILRRLVGLSSQSFRRVCVRNPHNYPNVTPGCGQRPTNVTFRTAASVDAPTGWYYITECACVGGGTVTDDNGSVVTGDGSTTPTGGNASPQLSFSVPPVQVRQGETNTVTPGGNATGDITFTGAPAGMNVTFVGGQISISVGPDVPVGTYTITAVRDGITTTFVVEVVDPNTTITEATTPTTAATPPTTPTDISTITSGSPPPTDTAPTPGETNNGSGTCANRAEPAPQSGILGACTGQNGQITDICIYCGYCHPCDWFWYGAHRCTGCGTGSDCASIYGISWCAVCLNCADCCNCGGGLTAPGLQQGACLYCTTGGVSVCLTCSHCVHCLYARPDWDQAQIPWGIVICGTSRQCGNCMSVANLPPR
jgi:hypothetical protein